MSERFPREMCNVNHGDLPLKLADLPESQGEPLRHVCAGCAYEAGKEAGIAEERARWEAKVRDTMKRWGFQEEEHGS